MPGPSARIQHEIDFKYAEAVATADDVATFRFVVKKVAPDHGLHATFMPKPIFGVFAAVTNPLVNSYKRLVPGYEAPVNVAWSEKNRSPLVRGTLAWRR